MSETKKSFIRFSIAQRIEHITLVLSFTTLGLTGLPQKYILSPVSQAVINGLGGIENIRVIHRVAATIFLLEAIYHLVVAGYKLFVRREDASMVPTIKDGRDAIESFLYNLGLRKDFPKMPRYNFAEKAEYWAMLWGLLVMALSGFMLWNPILTTNLFPGEFIPAAKVAHGGEAVLAVLAIILWHFWAVHLKMFNKSMFTGKMTRHEMLEEHGAELESIEAGRTTLAPAPEVQRQRMTLFIPAAAVVSLALLGGVYWFVTFEQTSITTIPRAEMAQVFVPQTPTPAPPTATPAPTGTPAPTSAPGEVVAAGPAWNGDLDGIFQQKCGACHGKLGGFSAGSYADAMSKIEAGSPDTSPVVKVQQAGDHAGKFSADELKRVIEWIQAGAPEQGAGGTTSSGGPAISGDATWSGAVSGLFEAKCVACHGSIGGFTAENYAKVMEKIKPGVPDDSEIVEVQKESHPARFSAEELQFIIDWIQAGAPE
jgi:cytochrome b subunit of formate dehydrogenase/mono/diheme cytochrome c family protein